MTQRHVLKGLTQLYRPVGRAELALVLQSGRFPPRLPGQPIFYPVLTESYAVEIARDWNLRDEGSGFAGFGPGVPGSDRLPGTVPGSGRRGRPPPGILDSGC